MIKKISLVLLVCLLLNTITYADYRQYERTGYLMVAHMGDWYKKGANTLEAYQSAADNGFYGTEGDLHYDEGILYMSHDKQATPSDFPTFEQFIDICKEGNIRPIVDIKWGMTDEGIYKALDLVKEKEMMDLVIWQDNFEPRINLIRKYDPYTEIWYLVGYNKESQREKAVPTAVKYGCKVINSSKTVLDPIWIQEMHEADLLTCVYSLNSNQERKDWTAVGIDIIMVDKE